MSFSPGSSQLNVSDRTSATAVAPEARRSNPSALSQIEEGALRVLAVVPGTGQGSSMIFVRRQIDSLTAIGINVRTFFLRSRTSPVVLIKEWRRLRREILRFQPDILHAHYGTITSLVCAFIPRVPLVITFRGNDLGDDPDISFVRTRLGQLLSQISALRATRIICVSRRLRNLLWWRKNSVAVIPTGVDLTIFQNEDKAKARAVLGWTDKTPVVLFDEGGAPRRKGSVFVHSAIAIAEKLIGAIRLVILDRSISPDLIPRYLNASDCLALASLFEGSPNIVKEALACNLPVVATDVGDVSERLQGVQPSRVVKRNVIDFAHALSEILRDGRRSNGRDHLDACSLPSVAQAIRVVYESALLRKTA